MVFKDPFSLSISVLNIIFFFVNSNCISQVLTFLMYLQATKACDRPGAPWVPPRETLGRSAFQFSGSLYAGRTTSTKCRQLSSETGGRKPHIENLT